MRVARYAVLGSLCLLVVFGTFPAAQVQAQARRSESTPLYRQFLSNPSPLELVAARNADRIAWTVYEEGKRNAYTAAAPLFTPIRLTNFMKDDGTDLSTVRISNDGSTLVFLRGTAPNRSGWVANPSADPDGATREIWAARTVGGRAFRVAEGSVPELAPDGSSVLFVKAGEIYRARVTPVRPASPMDRGEAPFIKNWGTQSSPKWSPDGKKIAFVTNRQDHSFVGVYDVASRTIRYMAPDVDFDSNPMWTADSKQIVFVRRPGQAFAQQGQRGGGGIGVPNGPAFQAIGRVGRGERSDDEEQPRIADVPGLRRGMFKGGYTLSLWKGDVATGEAKEVWHNEPDDGKFTTINNAQLAGDHVVFPLSVGGGRGRGRAVEPVQPLPDGPVDEWDRYYSIDTAGPHSAPVLLTTTDGLIENQASVAISADGKTLYYCTNARDIDRRHLWAVPVSGGAPWQVTSGIGIETAPAPLASGKSLVTMSADWKRPQTVAVWPLAGTTTQPTSAQKFVFPTPAGLKNFPRALHVEPTAVMTKAADGIDVPNQLFLPKDLEPGEKRPAIVFVHGGPARQMLLGYHHMHFYHWSYGINQWLASKGYVVLSINYRSGIGYGRSFRQAANTGRRGNAEYQDVLAGGKYLQSRPDVDPDRIGIWGLSYGGVLTAQALARDSELFKAGVDLAGVHLWGSSLDPDSVSFKSSAIGAIEGWTSPVLLVHGDDDRNVAFQQTTGLVQLLRQRDVYYELIVFPDDTHESMLHSRWMYTLDRMEQFLDRFLGGGSRRIRTEAAR